MRFNAVARVNTWLMSTSQMGIANKYGLEMHVHCTNVCFLFLGSVNGPSLWMDVWRTHSWAIFAR